MECTCHVTIKYMECTCQEGNIFMFTCSKSEIFAYVLAIIEKIYLHAFFNL
jgi:inhibitor of KinA sporulation pathway (predicted exonuclease)